MSKRKHYPLNTVSDSAWCGVCKTHTQHRVDGHRLGPCIPCMEELELQHVESQQEKPQPLQRGLFAEGKAS